MAVCCPRKKGCSPVVRSSRISILELSASASFNKEGVVPYDVKIGRASWGTLAYPTT